MKNPPTGGGGPDAKPLSPLDLRITVIVGPDAVDGVNGPHLPIIQVRNDIYLLSLFN